VERFGLLPGSGVALLPVAGGITGDAYQHPARFSAGFGAASLIAAGLCATAGMLAAVTIRNPPRLRPGGHGYIGYISPRTHRGYSSCRRGAHA
jgi:hypothetical protein